MAFASTSRRHPNVCRRGAAWGARYLLWTLAATAMLAAQDPDARQAVALEVDDAIGPATQDYFKRALESATE